MCSPRTTKLHWPNWAASEQVKETANRALTKEQEVKRVSSAEADRLKAQLKGAGEKAAALETKLDAANAAANKIDDVEKELRSANAQLEVLARDKKVALTKLLASEQAQQTATQTLAEAHAASTDKGNALKQVRDALKASTVETDNLRTQLKKAGERTAGLEGRLDAANTAVDKVDGP